MANLLKSRAVSKVRVQVSFALTIRQLQPSLANSRENDARVPAAVLPLHQPVVLPDSDSSNAAICKRNGTATGDVRISRMLSTAICAGSDGVVALSLRRCIRAARMSSQVIVPFFLNHDFRSLTLNIWLSYGLFCQMEFQVCWLGWYEFQAPTPSVTVEQTHIQHS